ncbi:MAG: hypothetical protein IJH48_02075, partial [Oscillospiraceae bacterium]|nr:hypothetical protein [Oscillospiraceae bacterium]
MLEGKPDQRLLNCGAWRAKLPFGRFDDRNGLSLAADAATARDAEKPPAAQKNKHPPKRVPVNNGSALAELRSASRGFEAVLDYPVAGNLCIYLVFLVLHLRFPHLLTKQLPTAFFSFKASVHGNSLIYGDLTFSHPERRNTDLNRERIFDADHFRGYGTL